MGFFKKHRYAGYLLAAAILLAAAVAIYPYDTAIYQMLRTFSHRVGKIHIVQEMLNLVRPFGKGDVVILIVTGLAIAGARRKAAHILIALLVVTVLIWPFKIGIARERPGFTNKHSFPSGDVATAAAFCVPLMTASPWTAPLAVVITGGVATGRVYDGRHFPSDVLAGAAFGILSSALALAILRRRPWQPKRVWFLAVAGLIVAFSLLNLTWARATPFVVDFLRVWGPPGAFLLIASLIPVWQRRKKQAFGIRSSRLLFPLLFAVYLSLTTASTLWDRDEPRFSRATVEMVESGNYLYPTFNGSLRPDKPILIYWLMSVPVRLLGVSELSCRLVAPIATLLAALLAAWIAYRLGGRQAGLLAGLCMMLTPLMAVSGTAATTDALLLACISGAIFAFLLSWLDGFRIWHILLMIASLAGAMLTKGPVGLVVPLLVIASIMIFVRTGAIRPLPYTGWLLFAVASSTILFLAWGLPANAATNGKFLQMGIGKHVVSRSLTAMESHGGKNFFFYFYYLPVLLLTFFPWTLYLPRLFARKNSPSPGNMTLPAATVGRLLLCWVIPVVVLMSLVATKLPHYILPAWPALAVATALGIQRASRDGKEGNRSVAAKTGLLLFLVVGSALGLGLIIAPWFLPLFGARIPATGVGLIFLAMVILAWRQYRIARHEAVAAILMAGMIAVLMSASLLLLPALEKHKPAPFIAEVILNRSDSSVPVTTCGFGEPSLNFYIGRSPIMAIETDALPAWAAAPGKGILVITELKRRGQRCLDDSPAIDTLDIIPGFNYSQGKWVRVHILTRDNAP